MNEFYFILFLLVGCDLGYGQECDDSGVKCVSCSSYQKCNGGVPGGEIISCENGEKCVDPILEQCKTKLKCFAEGECTTSGIFPDPAVETNFYVCLGDPFTGFSKYEFSCQPGQYFDVSTSMCTSSAVTDPTATTSLMTTSSESLSSDTTITSTTASDSTTSSSESLSSDATLTPTTASDSTTSSSESLSSDATLTPTTASDSTTSLSTETTLSSDVTTTTSLTSNTPIISTTPPSISTSPSSTTTTTTPLTTTTLTSTSVTTSSPTDSPIVCIIPGIFPVLTNCKIYYRCSTSLKVFYFTCPGNSYFNEIILKCSLMITPTCQEQILKNTTTPATETTTTTTPLSSTTSLPTTSPPAITSSTELITTTSIPEVTTTSSSISTTTTPALETTTPLVPTTTTPSPITFVCPSVGTYENPSSCKTYFRCSSSGQIFVFTCPGASYFNEMTKKCTLILTPRCVKLLQA